MDVRKPLFHFACLSLLAVGVWQLVSGDRALGWLCVLFFGGAWLAVAAGLAVERQLLPPRAAVAGAGIGALGMAVASGFVAYQAWTSSTASGFVLVLAGTAGALLFGAGGVTLLAEAVRSERPSDVLRRLTPPRDPGA